MSNKDKYKMILLGNKQVGKTSLFTRIDKDTFSGEYTGTASTSICKLKKQYKIWKKHLS